MTKEERSILEMLDKIVHSEPVRSRIEPFIKRVRTDLAGKPDALMSWEPVELETFGEQLPAAIHSGWVFILRAGVDTGAERHPNSHQRMMSFEGTGNMQTDAESADRSGRAASDIAWKSNVLVSDTEASLEQRWISIPQNVWHRPVIPKGADWVVVSFHTVPAKQLIEERPPDSAAGAMKRMLYLAPD